MSEETLNILNELTKKETTDLALNIMELTADNMVKDKEIERLKNTLNDIKEYVNFLFIFNQTINGKFSETIWGQEILDFIEDSDKE